MEAFLGKNDATYLQYVDMATDRILEKIKDIPFVKKSLQQLVRDFTQGMLELRIDTNGIYEGIEDDVTNALIQIFSSLGNEAQG